MFVVCEQMFVPLIVELPLCADAETWQLASGGDDDKADTGGPIFSDPPPTPIIPVNVTVLGLMDIHYEEIARQLTLIESDLYKAIKPWECLGQAWTKPDKATRAPNLLRFIHRFNQVSKWIAAEIVRVENLRQRVNVLAHAINIAQKCLDLHNLNACMAIMSGLQSTAVFRLKQTWAGLPKVTTLFFFLNLCIASFHSDRTHH
jgi:hypothetical protein